MGLTKPGSFFHDFPGLGRQWIAVDGPYNEHLIRDVGALNLALAVVFVWAAWRLSGELVAVAAVVAIVWGLPHLAYHLVNRDGLETVDLVANLGGLLLFVGLGVGLVVGARRLD